MKFSEKLKFLLDLLDCKNLRLAETSTIDPSLISRLKKGTRVPVKGSLIIDKLTIGICKIAIELNKENILREKLSLNNDSLLNEEIKNWLSSSDSGLRNSVSEKYNSTKNDSPKLIGKNLTELMRIFDISNISLAKALNVDPSLISRYKNGFRSVTVKNTIANDLCNYFIKKSGTKCHSDELIDLLNIKPDISLDIAIKNFLFSTKAVTSISAIDKFLESLDSLSLNSNVIIPEISSIITPELLSDNKNIYYDTIGLRQAVKKFLSTVIVNSEPTELLLYSDQSLYWMTGDNEFSKLWSILMIITLMRKNKIKIIHNLDRNINEMLDAIIKWLPLYLTGLIEPYSCNKGRQSRFSHTMFIAKDIAAIFGSFVPNNGKNAVYNYFTDKEIVKKYESQFDSLEKNSSPLLNIFTQNDSDKYLSVLLNTSKIKENALLLSSKLSFGTMPDELLIRILEKNKVRNAEKIFLCHKIAKECFLNYIKDNTFTEFVAIPDSNQISEGKIKLNITDLFLEEELFYTKSEFDEHLKSIHELTKQYSNYKFKEINKVPFHNIEIFCKHNSSVIVSKTDSPAISFKIDNMFMVNAFEKYIINII